MSTYHEVLKARNHTGGGDGDAARLEKREQADGDKDGDGGEETKGNDEQGEAMSQTALERFAKSEIFKLLDEAYVYPLGSLSQIT